MKYMEIKKVLIRLKSRKFLVSDCPICLQPVQNDSVCRMLNCYHIYHSPCIEKWFIEYMNCPNCKKSFRGRANKRYNLDEFLQTINVDNECFYSDHLIKSKDKLAHTNTILKNDPYFLKKKRQRIASFDLAMFLRKDNYMAELRADESHQGPLKIIKLPTMTAPILFHASVTPPTLARLGFHRSNAKSFTIRKSLEQKFNRSRSQDLLGGADNFDLDFEFHDVNEDYKEQHRINQITELKVIASSFHGSKEITSREMDPDDMPNWKRKRNNLRG